MNAVKLPLLPALAFDTCVPGFQPRARPNPRAPKRRRPLPSR